MPDKPAPDKPAEGLVEAVTEKLEAAAAAIAPKAARCPHCKGALVQHGDENPYKAGAWHCDGCGCCFKPDMSGLREGHPACPQSLAA